MTQQPQLDRLGIDIRDPWACPLPKRRVQLDLDLKEFIRVRREAEAEASTDFRMLKGRIHVLATGCVFARRGSST